MQPQIYWQIHKLAFKLEKQSDEALKSQTGIGFAQYKVLEAIGRNNLAKQNIVAEVLNQTEASISRQVKILQSKELIMIDTVMGNKRARELSLTEKGEELLKQCEGILEITQAKILNNLDFQEQRAFQVLLSKLSS